MIFYSPGVKDSVTRRFLFVETGIREVFLVDSGNLGFGIRNTLELKESGIPLTIKIRNPSSTDKETGFQYLESEIHGVESKIQNCLGFLSMGRFYLTQRKLQTNMIICLRVVLNLIVLMTYLLLTLQHLDCAFNDFIIAHQISFPHNTKGTRPQLVRDFKIRTWHFRPLPLKIHFR